MVRYKTMLLWGLLVLLGGCQLMIPATTKTTAGIDQISQTLDQAGQQKVPAYQPPAHISDALLPPLEVGVAPMARPESRFDLAVSEAPAKEFLMALVQDTPYNMVVHPNVAGLVTLELKNVTVADVMQVMQEVYGYDFEKNGNTYRVLPVELRTEIFQVDYVDVQRMGVSEMQVSAGQSNERNRATSATTESAGSAADSARDGRGSVGVTGTRLSTRTATDFWRDLGASLHTIIGHGEGRSVTVTPQAGLIIVRALPSELRSVDAFLRKAELSLQRQVILEAKILEVELNDGFQSGINWTRIMDQGTPRNVTFNLASDPLSGLGQVGGVFSASATLYNFTGLIELLETQGVVQVLSSPRVATVNNQKAVIKVGVDQFFVTDVNISSTSVGNAIQTTPSVQFSPFFSGIALDVTPQISAGGDIILHVHPTVSEVIDQTKVVELGDGAPLRLPMAQSSIRESDSIVRAQNGQVVVIGGLMQNTSNDLHAGAPLLGRLPLLGHLFVQKRQSSRKSELVILLRPVIADEKSLRDNLRESTQRVDSLRRGLQNPPLWYSREEQ